MSATWLRLCASACGCVECYVDLQENCSGLLRISMSKCAAVTAAEEGTCTQLLVQLLSTHSSLVSIPHCS